MSNFLLNYKTAVPSVVVIIGVFILFVFQAEKKITSSDFNTDAIALIAIGTFLIGAGAKDADK